MHKITGSLAILALLGATAAAAPSFAQSTTTTTTTTRGSIDCSLPANYSNPYCVRLRGQGHNGTGKGTNGALGSGGPGNNNSNASQGGQGGNAMASPNNSGPKPGSWNWSSHDRDMFHQRFRGFNFGAFATPNFSIHLGIGVPHTYYHYLRPVPRSIYRHYPWFRGYLYFVGRGGQFVIVSPSSHRIVAVI